MKTSLDPEKVTQEILGDVTEKHLRATRMLKDVVRDLTPEDTGLMEASYHVHWPTKEKHSIITTIDNSARSETWFEYPVVVEYWRWNVMFRYQKPHGRFFYAWVGAHPMGRAIEAFKKLFLFILKE